MTTTTSYSDKKRFSSFFLGLLKRNSGYIIFLTLVEFIFFPVQTALYLFGSRFNTERYFIIPSAQFHTVTSVIMIFVITVLAAIVIGLSQLGYMNSKRSVDVYHSLPISRNAMFTANLLTSFITVMLPLAINQIIAVALTVIKSLSTPQFRFNPITGITDFIAWSIVVFAVLACISFAQIQVGRSFDGLIFSMEVLFAPLALAFLTLMLFETFLMGFSFNRTFDPANLIYFSPIAAMVGRYISQTDTSGVFDSIMAKSNYTLALWLVLSAVLFWASIRLYKRRKSEIAESTVTNIPLVLFGKLAAIYTGGTLIGVIITSVFGSPMTNRWSFVIWTILGSIVVFVFLEFILLRGYKGISKSLSTGIVSVAIVGIFASILVTGGLGYETRVPSPEDVNSVTITYRGRYSGISEVDASTIRQRTTINEFGKEEIYYTYNDVNSVTLTSPEAIKIITDYHRTIADSIKIKRNDYVQAYANALIDYDLKGIDQKRYYGNIPEEALPILAKLEDTEEFKRKTHPVFILDESEFTSFTLLPDYSLEETAPISDRGTINALLEAVRKDMLAEKPAQDIGIKHNLNLRIYFKLAKDPSMEKVEENYFTNCYVDVNDTFTNTISLLKNKGFGDLITTHHPEYAMAYVGENMYFGGSSYSAIVTVSNYSKGEIPYIIEKFKGDSDDRLITNAETVKLLWNASTTQLYNSERVLSVFFMTEDEQNYTVRLIAFENLPDNIKDVFPYLRERYTIAMPAK